MDKYYEILKVNLKIPEIYGNNDKQCWSSEE